MDASTERFVRAIRTALVGPPELSQRDLCKKLGVTIGSLSKYLRGEVAPDKVGFGVQCKLASTMGHTVDTLMRFYETGEWSSDTRLSDVVDWIRSEAGQSDLPALLESMQIMTNRSLDVSNDAETSAKPDYLWPLTELKSAEVSDKMRNKLGLTDEALWALAKDGTFDDELVEAFSLACDYEEEAVREAFTNRTPVT
jgi:transcriptional regulator with XRE-family HTH domain